MNSRWTKSSFSGAALTVAALLAPGIFQPRQAEASFTLRLTHVESATTVTVVDDGVGDLENTTPGQILFSDPVGVFTINVTTGLSKPLIGNDPTFAHMDLNSVNVTGSSAGTLIIELTDTDFPAFTSDPGVFLAQVGGTTGGTVEFDAYKSSENGEFDTSGLHIELPEVGTFGPGEFSDSDFLIHGVLPTYSMTLVATISHSGPAITSFDLEVFNTTPERIPGVPEPTSLAIWSLGMGALGFVGYKRRKRVAV